MLAPLLCTALALNAAPPVWAQEQKAEDDAFAALWERFAALSDLQQEEIVDEIRARILGTDDADLRPLVDRAAKAQSRLDVKPHQPLTFYDPAKFAPGQKVERSFISPEDPEAQRILQLYRPWESLPPFYAGVRYDFATGNLVQAQSPLTPTGRLWNLLEGYPPYVDALVASLQQRWDHRQTSYRKLAKHFQHAYCDLRGRAFEGVSLYDALASEEGLDMPDVDVIPFARLILKDDSFRSPIPAGRKRSRLYEQVKERFLPYFQHRSFIETASYLYVNPDVEYRSRHEGMRKNLLFCFANEKEDPRRILTFFRRSKDRNGFMTATKKETDRDERWWARMQSLEQSRVRARWAVHGVALDVLSAHGLLDSP